MKMERKKQISELIEETFNNVQKLNALLKKSDYDWAKKNYDSDEDDNYELAENILNVGDNLVDWGKMFRS
jgi:glycosylphosphatidylinositol transamidase (GPIT) subunit GPI8